MAKECITGCWRIRQIIDDVDSDNIWAGPLAIHPDLFSSESGASRLLRMCGATYDCPTGPGQKEVEVEKGRLWWKHTETEVRPTCGLPNTYFGQ